MAFIQEISKLAKLYRWEFGADASLATALASAFLGIDDNTKVVYTDQPEIRLRRTVVDPEPSPSRNFITHLFKRGDTVLAEVQDNLMLETFVSDYRLGTYVMVCAYDDEANVLYIQKDSVYPKG